ncbi:MAG: amino acid racemase [Firmicutes bacterium]|nr:amino acid racemase [Bacillota bacterium]
MIIGIMGGMGPAATNYTFEKLIKLTDASKDQEHLHIIIDNNTEIPDRTEYILGNGENPITEMIRSAIKLELMGAGYIIMPCNTAHYFYDEISRYTNSHIIHMIRETAKFSQNTYSDSLRFLLLSTTGTYASGIYKKTFSEYGLDIIEPSDEDKVILMKWIYDIKSGVYVSENEFNSLVSRYVMDENIPVVLGCSELSYLSDIINIKKEYINPVSITVNLCIDLAGKKI